MALRQNKTIKYICESIYGKQYQKTTNNNGSIGWLSDSSSSSIERKRTLENRFQKLYTLNSSPYYVYALCMQCTVHTAATMTTTEPLHHYSTFLFFSATLTNILSPFRFIKCFVRKYISSTRRSFVHLLPLPLPLLTRYARCE